MNRRVSILQPRKGYRVAVDTVLLAAAVPAEPGQQVLELGCGVGGAMLCLAARVPDLAVTGVEIQDELFALCQKNIARNSFANKCDVFLGDAGIWAVTTEFDHAFMNPPYHDAARHDVSGLAQRRVANSDEPDELAEWIECAAGHLKPGGSLTVIHRADRLKEVLDLLEGDGLGGAEIVEFVTKAGSPAQRVIVRAWQGRAIKPPTRRSLTLHAAQVPGDAVFSPEGEAILRDAAALTFSGT